MVGRTVYISPLQADSMLNQANLFKKLLQECGYEGVFKSTITVEDLNKDDVAGAIWFQLASINFIGDAIVPYILGRKPKVLYVTIEGVLTKGNVVHSNIKRCEFVAVSNFVKECLQSVGLKVRKVVHHAIDWKLCGAIHKRNLIQRRQIQQYAKDRVKFIVVARDDPRKNLKGLAEAMKILNKKGYEKDYVVFLISDESAKQKFQGINNAVFIKGFGGSAHEFVLGYMACCDYLIHPAFCLPPDTKIICYDGVKPISEVKEGDLVLTHKGRFRRVTRVFKRYYKGELIGIKPVKMDRWIWMTPEHPILAIKKPWCWSKRKLANEILSKIQPFWIMAKDITKKHAVIVPKVKDDDISINTYKLLKDTSKKLVLKDDMVYTVSRNQFGATFIHPNVKPIPATINPSNEFLELSGYYIAEGCSDENGIAICFSQLEKDKIERALELISKFGMKPRLTLSTRNRAIQWGTGRLWGLLFGRLYGRKAHEKRVPPFLLQLPKDKLEILFKAMFEGDGYIDKHNYHYYNTVSEELALETFLLLIKLGYLPSFYDETNTNHGYKVGFSKNERFTRAKQNEQYMFLPIEEIKVKPYEGYVYNLEVEEDNSYVAECIAVHNCEGFGLPVLEAMAVGRPCIHADYPPLNEFTSPDFNFMFNYVDKQAVKCNIYQYWLFHIFTPDMLAEMISYAIDVYKNSKDEYQEYCTKAREHTKNWDYHIKYVELMKELNLVIPRELIDYVKHGLEWITEIR